MICHVYDSLEYSCETVREGKIDLLAKNCADDFYKLKSFVLGRMDNGRENNLNSVLAKFPEFRTKYTRQSISRRISAIKADYVPAFRRRNGMYEMSNSGNVPIL